MLPPQGILQTYTILNYTTFTIFSMKYLVMCKVYTDVGGIKLVDYLHVQADNPWYNYYLTTKAVSNTRCLHSVGRGISL